jgi:hypothetical protein
MTYIQLLTGLTSFFLNEQYQKFQKWIEPGWLISLWEFLNYSSLTYLMPKHWIPKPSRVHNRALMEYFLEQDLHHSIIDSINHLQNLPPSHHYHRYYISRWHVHSPRGKAWAASSREKEPTTVALPR